MAGPERSGEIDLDGRRLAWRALGAGPPLVMVNGYAATAADWDRTLLAALGEAFELICPDNRGVGGSELGEGAEPGIDAMAGDVERLLDAFGLDRAPVLGWSMGGFVAQRLALRAPARVAALVLLSTDPGGPEAVAAEAHVWAGLIDHSGSPREQASRLISLLFPAELAPEIDEQFGELVATARAELDPAALTAQEIAMDDWRSAEQPRPDPAATSPVLAACGSEDVVIPPANTRAIGERWPGARVELFAGGGHAFMAQEPARLSGLIESFLPR